MIDLFLTIGMDLAKILGSILLFLALVYALNQIQPRK